MTLALSLFVLFYILMLAVQQYRPWVALGGAGAFLLLGKLGVYDFTLADAARAVDFNVLLMMAGMMGTVFLFIQSKMPARLAEELIAHVPDVRWAVSVLALLAGFISAFVDNVATVLMVAPVGLAIARRLKLSPVPVLIAIAVSSNLQGAATLVGDTTSILLGGFAGMNIFDFFWMEGRPGIKNIIQHIEEISSGWRVGPASFGAWSWERWPRWGCCSGCSGTSASPSMLRWKRRWRTTSPRRFSC